MLGTLLRQLAINVVLHFIQQVLLELTNLLGKLIWTDRILNTFANGPIRTDLGYEVVENTSANRLNDYVLVSKGFARGTVRTLVTKRADVNPTWLPYVRVKSVSETVDKAKQLGGSVLIEPKPEVFEGKIAVIADPTGAAVGVMEWSPELMKGGR